MNACLSFEQFYNADETSFSLKMLPLYTPASRKEKSAPNYKRSRRLMTILACCIASGNHKLNAFVKSSKTETFRNWVLTEIIPPYSTKRRANIVIDNAPSHSNNMKINIEKI
jgi:hypothetical protein